MNHQDRHPLVSVVITCCNQARVLADAVASVTARSARPQIVVVDEGSTDGTTAVARRLNVIFERMPNRGRAAARNRGLMASTGEFVIFLDAADRLLPGGIDTGLRALTLRPDCAMGYGRALLSDPDGGIWPAPEIPIVRAGHHAALLQTNLIWMPAMAIFRRDAVQRAGGFVEGLDGAADYDLYLRISRDSGVVDHGCAVAVYGGALDATQGQAARLLRDTLDVMRRNCPDPHTPLHSAWREGYARWQEIYGAQLVDEIRGHLREHGLAAATRKGIALWSLAPRVFVSQLGRWQRPLEAARQRRANNTAGPAPSANVPSAVMPTSASRP